MPDYRPLQSTTRCRSGYSPPHYMPPARPGADRGGYRRGGAIPLDEDPHPLRSWVLNWISSEPQKRGGPSPGFNLVLPRRVFLPYAAQGDLTFDHVVPAAVGGVTKWENVVAVFPVATWARARKACVSQAKPASRRASAGARNCATWGGSFRRTTCTKAGSSTSFTGTAKWRPDPRCNRGGDMVRARAVSVASTKDCPYVRSVLSTPLQATDLRATQAFPASCPAS